ncbi:MAG TPA: Crp/Fnr family transcriptional regulator [Actinomycetota bacterium]|nr:Crp/Fnr family transcriptional regulator [Actinomycetota bacterium]
MVAITNTNQTAAFPLLRQTLLSKFLDESQLRELEEFCRATTRKAGNNLFRQGDRAEVFYLMADGCVELRARPPGRRVYRTVELVVPGCTFGDETLFGETEYLAGARVIEQARLLMLNRSEFDRLIDARPAIASGILRCSGSCLTQTIRRAAILTQAPADVALRTLLEELASPARQNGDPVSVRITHAQLAGVLHVSRETVSRMLGQLVGQGLVELGRGVIRVRSHAE